MRATTVKSAQNHNHKQKAAEGASIRRPGYRCDAEPQQRRLVRDSVDDDAHLVRRRPVDKEGRALAEDVGVAPEAQRATLRGLAAVAVGVDGRVCVLGEGEGGAGAVVVASGPKGRVRDEAVRDAGKVLVVGAVVRCGPHLPVCQERCHPLLAQLRAVDEDVQTPKLCRPLSADFLQQEIGVGWGEVALLLIIR